MLKFDSKYPVHIEFSKSDVSSKYDIESVSFLLSLVRSFVYPL